MESSAIPDSQFNVVYFACKLNLQSRITNSRISALTGVHNNSNMASDMLKRAYVSLIWSKVGSSLICGLVVHWWPTVVSFELVCSFVHIGNVSQMLSYMLMMDDSHYVERFILLPLASTAYLGDLQL